MKNRIAIVVSHPIQHFCPQYVSFARNQDVEFKVFFGSMLGYKKYYDPNFKMEVSWSDLNLDQFNHTFLNGDKILPSTSDLDAPTLDNSLVEFKPNLVIIYGYFQKLQRRAHHWAISNKVKLGYISDSELRHSRNKLRELIKYPFLRNFFSKIDYFLSVGNANEEFYAYYNVSSKHIVRMHFPINISLYEKKFLERKTLRDQVRLKLQISNDEFVISVVGKLVQWKNQDHIIDAIQILEKEGVTVHLLIIGSGEMMNQLRQKALSLKSSKVNFPGFVSPEDLPSYYAASDGYVHPASLEPHSIAISEAIYMGCPVILSDRCGSYGSSDDVQENRNGWVYKFGSISELAAKIKMLSASEKLRTDFGKHSIKISREFQKRSHFSMLKELNNVLQ
jgi:glycosyltransferase involved in cell wall biosynthesis